MKKKRTVVLLIWILTMITVYLSWHFREENVFVQINLRVSIVNAHFHFICFPLMIMFLSHHLDFLFFFSGRLIFIYGSSMFTYDVLLLVTLTLSLNFFIVQAPLLVRQKMKLESWILLSKRLPGLQCYQGTMERYF